MLSMSEDVYEIQMGRGNFMVSRQSPINSVFLKQVHGSQVINIRKANELIQADGIYWTWDDLTTEAPTIFTADCLPIMIEGLPAPD